MTYDPDPMFNVLDFQDANSVRRAIIERQNGVVFDLLVTIATGTAEMFLRCKTRFVERDEELLHLGEFPILGDDEVRFSAQIADPMTKKWRNAIIVLNTETTTGSVMLWTE